jgi:hypothetical protein
MGIFEKFTIGGEFFGSGYYIHEVTLLSWQSTDEIRRLWT